MEVEWSFNLLYTRNELDLIRGGGGGELFGSDLNLRTTFSVAMVCLGKWGF